MAAGSFQDPLSSWLTPFCCSDNRRQDDPLLPSRNGHKPEDITRRSTSYRDSGTSELFRSHVSQKCGCGIVFAADQYGKLVVDGFVHGGSAESSRVIAKGAIFDYEEILRIAHC